MGSFSDPISGSLSGPLRGIFGALFLTSLYNIVDCSTIIRERADGGAVEHRDADRGVVVKVRANAGTQE